MNGGRRDAQAVAQGTRSKEDPWEAKARDRTRLRNEKQPKLLIDRHLAQARHVSEQPTSRPSPTSPDPQSQSLSRSYGSNLPTSLTYINLSTRGSSPWRPAADMGTARREIYTLSPGFSRASESSPDAAGTATLSKARAPLSGRTHSRAPCPSQRKENSPRGSRRLLRDRLRYRTGRLAAPISATPDSGI